MRVLNVLVAAALAIGTGGAVVAASMSDSPPPRVGDPVNVTDEFDDDDPSANPPGDNGASPSEEPSQDGTAGQGDDDDAGDDPDEQPGDGTGRIDDVDEVFPSPRTLDDDDSDDGRDDEGTSGDDTDDGGTDD